MFWVNYSFKSSSLKMITALLVMTGYFQRVWRCGKTVNVTKTNKFYLFILLIESEMIYCCDLTLTNLHVSLAYIYIYIHFS